MTSHWDIFDKFSLKFLDTKKVLDEADRLLQDDFEDEMEKVTLIAVILGGKFLTRCRSSK